MILVQALLGVTALAIGAAGLYAATPHQAMIRPPLDRGRARIIGGVALVAALACFLRLMGPATAVFAWMTGLMLFWTIPPVILAWARRKRT